MSRMSRVLPVFAIMAAASLAACGDRAGPNEAADAATGESTLAEDAVVPIQPGMWEHVTTVTGAQIPGAPPEMMQALIGQPTTVSSCVTKEQLAEGPEALFNQSDGQCVYEEFTMADGTMEVTGTCTNPQAPGPLTLTGSGTYDDTSYMARTAVTMAMPGGGELRIESDTAGRRTGDC